MKKLFAILLALVMLMGTVSAVTAAGTPPLTPKQFMQSLPSYEK